MKTQLFAACALAGLIAVPAMAQVTGAAAAPPSSSMPSSSMPSSNMPSSHMPSSSAATTPPGTAATAPTTTEASPGADTGTAANTAATASDLKLGAAVTDSTGAELGTISKVAKGKTDADTMITLKANGKTKTVPASSLALSGGALVSSQTKTDIWGPK
jgi:hypothetical protein